MKMNRDTTLIFHSKLISNIFMVKKKGASMKH